MSRVPTLPTFDFERNSTLYNNPDHLTPPTEPILSTSLNSAVDASVPSLGKSWSDRLANIAHSAAMNAGS